MHVWAIWHELDARRGNNGFGPNPLSYQDMYFYQQVTGRRLRPVEVWLLCQVDTSYIAWYSVQSAPQPQKD